ncbi:COG1361 S-layer family protein [Haloarchaeobius sp. HME9146]|uniref:COG1361 S-layer family protein n=1 Tax=Haloarchaeobius sp. HME9146 TaxID=2978732 RepID=UPI0021BF1AE8|nr:COG1361 S-layer family protein [Haloarchaeobius sp. HME9146]MCT9097966.1 COG1361 S-layer family protein [Haloarchaeobius sp. HME9146]
MSRATTLEAVVLVLLVLVSTTLSPVVAASAGQPAASSATIEPVGTLADVDETLPDNATWNRTQVLDELDRWANETGVANESWWNATRVLDSLEHLHNASNWTHEDVRYWANETVYGLTNRTLEDWHNETNHSNLTEFDPEVIEDALRELQRAIEDLFEEEDERSLSFGFPHVTPYLPENYLRPDEEATLRFQVVNDGAGPEVVEVDDGGGITLFPSSNGNGLETERLVTSARNVEIQLLESSGVPIEVRTDVVPLGWVDQGTVVEAPVRVSVDEDARPGFYELNLVVRYEAVDTVDDEGRVLAYREEVVTFPMVVEITVDARFQVVSTGSDLQVGSSGVVSFVVENVGFDVARDATVVVTSESGDLTFTGSNRDGRFVGDLEPGQRERVTFRVDAGEQAIPDTYAFRGSVTYTDRDGEVVDSTTFSIPVRPDPEQRFAVSDLTSTLRVDYEDGVIRGLVTNLGPRNASDAIVRLAVQSDTIVPTETTYAVGSLAAGQNASFVFPVEVRDTADPGPRQVDFTVEYRDVEDDRRQSDDLPATVLVEERRDEFAVVSGNATVTVGRTGKVVVVVTNNRDEVVRNVNARLFATDPLSAEDDSAFIESIAPGERVELLFSVSASGSAQLKRYPVTVDLLFEKPDGETKLSDTFQVGVTVVEPQTRGFTIPTWVWYVLAVLVFLGGFLYVWRGLRKRANAARKRREETPALGDGGESDEPPADMPTGGQIPGGDDD